MGGCGYRAVRAEAFGVSGAWRVSLPFVGPLTLYETSRGLFLDGRSLAEAGGYGEGANGSLASRWVNPRKVLNVIRPGMKAAYDGSSGRGRGRATLRTLISASALDEFLRNRARRGLLPPAAAGGYGHAGFGDALEAVCRGARTMELRDVRGPSPAGLPGWTRLLGGKG
ncbi:MAG: hypothetical protein LBG06_09900 [Deltaproteobacteria bacterium]|nr:hypothetical protein [Deltaproteobacteria bacterium]